MPRGSLTNHDNIYAVAKAVGRDYHKVAHSIKFLYNRNRRHTLKRYMLREGWRFVKTHYQITLDQVPTGCLARIGAYPAVWTADLQGNHRVYGYWIKS